MRILICVTLLLIFLGCSKKGKEINVKTDFGSAFEELVLNEGKIGFTYFLKEPVDKGVLERKITYLGKTKDNKKLLYSTIFSGLYEDSKRANSKILFYSDKSLKLGQFYISGMYGDIPILEGNKLLIKNETNNCDEITEIDLTNGIPNEIFIHCKEENGKMLGDVYEFEKQE